MILVLDGCATGSWLPSNREAVPCSPLPGNRWSFLGSSSATVKRRFSLLHMTASSL